MAFLHIAFPNRLLYLRTRLHGVGHADSDAEMRENFRLIVAVLLALWADANNPDLSGIRGTVFDIATSEFFYENGYAKTIDNGDERLWFCSYIGFEQITSQWAKENHPTCNGCLCMRLYSQDNKHREMGAHTIQIYF